MSSRPQNVATTTLQLRVIACNFGCLQRRLHGICKRSRLHFYSCIVRLYERLSETASSSRMGMMYRAARIPTGSTAVHGRSAWYARGRKCTRTAHRGTSRRAKCTPRQPRAASVAPVARQFTRSSICQLRVCEEIEPRAAAVHTRVTPARIIPTLARFERRDRLAGAVF